MIFDVIVGSILVPLLFSYLIFVKDKYKTNDIGYLVFFFILGCINVIPIYFIEEYFSYLDKLNKFLFYLFSMMSCQWQANLFVCCVL